MTALHDATIWRVSEPGKPAPEGRSRPGKVIAARMTRVRAEEMAAELRGRGVECVVNRV